MFNCDLDISKPNLGNRRPDIIIHKRNSRDFNLLVIEVKRDAKPSDIEQDVKKIEQFWFNYELNYKFGVAINLKRDKSFEIMIIKNEGKGKYLR